MKMVIGDGAAIYEADKVDLIPVGWVPLEKVRQFLDLYLAQLARDDARLRACPDQDWDETEVAWGEGRLWAIAIFKSELDQLAKKYGANNE